MTLDNIKKTLTSIWDEFLAFLYRTGILKDPWEERKKELCKDLDNNQAVTLYALLDNTRAFIINHRKTEAGFPAILGPAGLYAILPDLVAEIYKNLLCKYLIGVQPMKGPVSLVYTLDYTEVENAIDEAPKRLTLNVISHAVEAATQRLQSSWTLECMQDLQALHGSYMGAEIVRVLGAEVACEIDARIINDLIHGAAHSDSTIVDISDLNSMNALGVIVNKICNDIAQATRRGAGNWIVTSPMVVSLLQSAPKTVFTPAIEGSFKGVYNTMLVGTLNGTIEVYSNLGLGGGEGIEETMLIGYKGKSSETDAGVVFAPYQLLLPGGVVVNPVTFQPVMSCFTRYGLTARGKEEDLTQTKNYYGVLKVQGLLKFE